MNDGFPFEKLSFFPESNRSFRAYREYYQCAFRNNKSNTDGGN